MTQIVTVFDFPTGAPLSAGSIEPGGTEPYAYLASTFGERPPAADRRETAPDAGEKIEK